MAEPVDLDQDQDPDQDPDLDLDWVDECRHRMFVDATRRRERRRSAPPPRIRRGKKCLYFYCDDLCRRLHYYHLFLVRTLNYEQRRDVHDNRDGSQIENVIVL